MPVAVLPLPRPLRCVDMGGVAGCPSTGTQPCAESGQAAMVLDSWLPTAAAATAIQGRWRPPDAPRAKEAWRAVGLPDANPWALGGLASLAEVGWSTGAAQQTG